MSHAAYLSKLFDRTEQDKVVSDIKKIIKERDLKFDGFVVTGVSGIVMGSILSRLLRKELVVIRKDADNTHSCYNVENYRRGRVYIFLDDLIASGNTYKRVKETINICGAKKWLYGDTGNASKIIGAILYDPVGLYDECEYKTLRQLGKFTKKNN